VIRWIALFGSEIIENKKLQIYSQFFFDIGIIIRLNFRNIVNNAWLNLQYTPGLRRNYKGQEKDKTERIPAF
jgi:hypothetical protein